MEMEEDIDNQNFNIKRVLGIKKINESYLYYVKMKDKKPEWINLNLCQIKKNQFFIDLMINQWEVVKKMKNNTINISNIKTEYELNTLNFKDDILTKIEVKQDYEEFSKIKSKFKSLKNNNLTIIDLSIDKNEKKSILAKEEYFPSKEKKKKKLLIDLTQINCDEIIEEVHEENFDDYIEKIFRKEKESDENITPKSEYNIKNNLNFFK